MDPLIQALMMGAAGSGAGSEDVFSTWLYTGNGSTQTITNGIDLSGKGGLVWVKQRDQINNHYLTDTARGNTANLSTNNTNGTYTATHISSFNATGFALSADANVNGSNSIYASWTFRKAAKFFDVVTYTGDGSNRTIAHNLGSVPGCIIVKQTSGAGGDWSVYHRSLATPTNQFLKLNTQDGALTGTDRWAQTAPTSSVFSIGNPSQVNAAGESYVAYLFAHDAGGFGDSGNDSVVSCGSYTGNGSATGPTVTLGWEPQWLMIKRTDAAYDWWFSDNMRGMVVGGDDKPLLANTANAEQTFDWMSPTATGFQLTTSNINFNASSGTYIYIAIRRGPMKTPTDATKVFSAITGISAPDTSMTVGFPADMYLATRRGESISRYAQDRLRGFANTNATGTPNLFTDSTAAETTSQSVFAYNLWNTTAIAGNQTGNANSIWHYFRRAPGFFDVVTYTGTGTARTVPHNLGVTPELMIVKQRNTARNWFVYHKTPGATKYLTLNEVNGQTTASPSNVIWNDTDPTSALFSLGDAVAVNGSGDTYIAYLFASCPGVSKVGSYTGTGTTLQINCGFTNGARFVLIKRTDSTGDWYVWDTARGIISGNDPYLLLNSTSAEVTSTDYIDPLNSGFEISSTAPAAINANGGTYIYLAIA